MPRNYWSHLKTDQESFELLKFLREKSQNVDFPLQIKNLCEEFKEVYETSSPVDRLSRRIRNLRHKIYDIEDMDVDTRVKMIFMLSTPVDIGFFNMLKRQAEVKLDGFNRIRMYKKNDGSLYLEASYSRPFVESHALDQKLFTYLARKCSSVDPVSQISDTMFLKEFKENTETIAHVDYLRKRYRWIKNEIYGSPEIDKSLEIKMLFVSNTKIHNIVLKELKEDAIVELDSIRRIIRYEAYDGSLSLHGSKSFAARTGGGRIVENERAEDELSDSDSSDQDDNIDEVTENESKTKSGRISKRRFDENFSYYESSDKSNSKSSSSNVKRIKKPIHLPKVSMKSSLDRIYEEHPYAKRPIEDEEMPKISENDTTDHIRIELQTSTLCVPKINEGDVRKSDVLPRIDSNEENRFDEMSFIRRENVVEVHKLPMKTENSSSSTSYDNY